MNYKELLTFCANGKDMELANYASDILHRMGYGLPMAEEDKTERFPDRIIMQMYRSGDDILVKKSKEIAVEQNQKSIRYVIWRIFPSYAVKNEEDMYNCGVIGLIKSMSAYDGSTALTTYSRPYIIHEIAEYICYLNNTSLYHSRVWKRIDSAGEGLSDAEIAEKTGFSEKMICKERAAMDRGHLVYLDAFPEHKNVPSGDVSMDSIEDKILSEEIFDFIEDSLPEQKKTVIKMKILGNATYKDIAMKLGISAPTAKSRYSSGIKIIREEFAF